MLQFEDFPATPRFVVSPRSSLHWIQLYRREPELLAQIRNQKEGAEWGGGEGPRGEREREGGEGKFADVNE